MTQALPDYTLRRSARRRTIEIQVRPDSVRVLAPARVSRSRIDHFVQQKADWISQRQADFKARLPRTPEPLMLQQGSSLWFKGNLISLNLLPSGSKTRLELEGSILHLALSRRIRKPALQAITEQLELWYRQQAEVWFNQRVEYWSEYTGLRPSAIKVRSYRRKWGCCSQRGEVRFNWQLIMAPAEIIDYVIVHELCHLREMNHSARYWQLVAEFLPAYHQARQWLNNNGQQLQWPPLSL